MKIIRVYGGPLKGNCVYTSPDLPDLFVSDPNLIDAKEHLHLEVERLLQKDGYTGHFKLELLVRNQDHWATLENAVREARKFVS